MKNFRFILVLILAGLGVFLRSTYFFYNRSMWFDETSLAFNILDKNWWEFFLPLAHRQTAPVFFMILTKCLSIEAYPEMSMRIIPFLSGLISIGIFWIFVQKFIQNKWGQIFAFGFFCFNTQLIFYSQEFKQYGSDALFFMLVLLSAFSLDFKEVSWKKLLKYGLLYALSIGCSQTAIFAVTVVFTEILLTTSFFQFKKPFFNWGNIRKYLILTLPFVLVFIPFFLTQFYFHPEKEYFSGWWAKEGGFFENNLTHNKNLFWTNMRFFFPFDSIGLLFIAGLMCFGFTFFLINWKKKESRLIVLSILLAFTLTALKIYPLLNRVILYLLPLFIILFCKIWDLFSKGRNKQILSLLLVIPFSFLLGQNTVESYRLFGLKEYNWDNPKDAMILAKEYGRPDDIFIMQLYRKTYHDFYMKTLNFHPKHIIKAPRERSVIGLKKHLDRTLVSGKRYVYVHHHRSIGKKKSMENYAKDKPDFQVINTRDGKGIVIWRQP